MTDFAAIVKQNAMKECDHEQQEGLHRHRRDLEDYQTYRVIRMYDSELKRNVSIRVDLSFDLDKIANKLGRKAWRNTTRKSSLISGGIVGEAREFNV